VEEEDLVSSRRSFGRVGPIRVARQDHPVDQS
jgi:hypothetical protein